ncbi:unnamed protein product [Thelazia callipaeda]|uniref:S-adenosylmethionine mitochondrial carrier protein n=1 Tax=Thelazia callipaeda TaxID=103827 RepID=A0A0N5D2Y5_THECL|nr:unnamed protein product [Thelazia callipaeda]
MDYGFYRSLVCGAAAGFAVDMTLYPLDTVKTRLQSAQGFSAAGGLRNVYRGMGSVAVGSAPGAALFFCSYNFLKQAANKESEPNEIIIAVAVNACAASFSEIVACVVRVPTELIKQRAQARQVHNISTICRKIYSQNGLRGFYQGFFSTVSREIPFSFIEFPLWELLKQLVTRVRKKHSTTPLESAACGSAAGSVAAAITTPLDVVKTQIMLDDSTSRVSTSSTMARIWRNSGYRGLFAGLIPRSVWMGIGGFVFFGAYEATTLLTENILSQP